MTGVPFHIAPRVFSKGTFLLVCSIAWLLPVTPVQAQLPAAVTSRLRQVDRALEKGEKMLTAESERYDLDYRVKTARAAVQSARDIMAEIVQRYGKQLPDPCPEMQAATERINTLEKQTDALEKGGADAQAQTQANAAASAAASEPWIARLKPYVTGLGQPGYDADKYLVPSATMEEKEMLQRLKIYAEASMDLAAYRKAEFTAGKTEQLQEIEKQLVDAMDVFKRSCGEYVQENVKQAQKALNDASEFLKKQEAKTGAEDKPLTLQKLQLRHLRQAIDYLAILAESDNKDLAALNKAYAELLQRDEKIRKSQIAQTRMIADKYKGEDKETLKQTAQKIVKTKFPQATILRTTLISEDWKEERVFEFTDTTHTAIRYRVTRSVTAQVAGKQGQEVFLYTLDISKDRLTDGAWGTLYGHIMFTDPMLEENVTK